jgi:hypothetical protein
MKSVIKNFGKNPGEIHNINGILVPKEGLEPSCPQGARDFESRASANSATSALQAMLNLMRSPILAYPVPPSQR